MTSACIIGLHLCVSVCTVYYWSGTSRSVMLAKKLAVISVVELEYGELVMGSAQVVCWESYESPYCGSGPLCLYVEQCCVKTV